MSDFDTKAAVAAASTAFGQPLRDPAPLGGSTRSLVLRVSAADRETVVIKQYPDDDEGGDSFLRERVGLEVLANTPDLLAVNESARVVVMSDLGTYPTLADLLRGDDPDRAWAAAMRWARALGELAAGSRGRVDEVESQLPASAGRTELTSRIAAGVEALAEASGAAIPDRLSTELERVDALWAGRSGLVVSPGDTCPDNALINPDGVRFLDLEGAGVHPIAFDAAYALLPFATCWCVYDPPPGFLDDMLAAFTEGVRYGDADVLGPNWEADVRTACVGWTLAMTGVLLKYTDDPERRMGPPERPALTMRQHVLMRLRRLAGELSDDFPDVRRFAGDSLLGLEAKWGALRVERYPAFESG